MPLVDGLLNVILTALEMVKGKLSVKITEYTVQIQKMSTLDEETTAKNVIGFALPDYEEEEDEEEDEDL